MTPCPTCQSTGDWRCINCPPTFVGPPQQKTTPERRKAQKRAQYERWYAKNQTMIRERARLKYQSTKHLRPAPAADRPTTLYRFWDADGVLLYVGITYHFDVRLTQHRSRSEWFSAVDRWTIETYHSRRVAKIIETQAIREERPRFNRHESTD